MDEGFTIPIEGDAEPFREALRELRQALNQVMQSMQQQAAAANQAGQATVSALDKTLDRAGKAGNAIGGLATGFSVAAQAARALGRLKIGGGIQSALSNSKVLSEGIRGVGATMRSLMRSKTFRVIAVGAAGAAVSVLAVRTAWRSVQSAARLAGRVISGALRGARAAVRGLRAGLLGIKRTLGGLGAMFSAALPITGLVSLVGVMASFGLLVKKSVGAAQDFEVLRVRMEQFTGSIGAAKELMEELDAFSIDTPFEGGNVQNTALKLLGAGIKEEVAAIVRELGAVAGTSGETLEELGDAMAKGFARGRFQTEELNKFLERGINLLPELEKVTGKTGDDLRKAIEKGLTFDQVRAGIASLSGPGAQFEDMLKRMSVTGKGLFSTLSYGIQILLREFGTPINDALRPMLQEAIQIVKTMRDQVREMGEGVGKAMAFVFAAFKAGRLGDVLGAGFRVAVTSAVDGLMRGLQGAVAFLGSALPPLFGTAMAKLRDPAFWDGIAGLMRGLGHNIAASIYESTWRAGEAANARSKASAEVAQGMVLINDVAKGGNVAEAVSQALKGGLRAASDAARRPTAYTDDAQKARSTLRELFMELQPVMKKLREGAAVPGPPRQGDRGPQDRSQDEREFTPAKLPSFATIASSMARIGGGGIGFTLFEPQLAEARRQTGVQKQILKEIRLGNQNRGRVAAVYA